MARAIPRDCPECGGGDLRVTVTPSGRHVSVGAADMLELLPGLGGWLTAAPLSVVVCRDCGLVRCFAQPAALAKLDTAPGGSGCRRPRGESGCDVA